MVDAVFRYSENARNPVAIPCVEAYMVETRASTESRSADGRRFEVFVRETAAESLRHVGTVKAPTPEAAHEEAAALFGWTARDIWVCPAESTHRYTTEPLAAYDDAADPAASDTDTARSETNRAEPATEPTGGHQ